MRSLLPAPPAVDRGGTRDSFTPSTQAGLHPEGRGPPAPQKVGSHTALASCEHPALTPTQHKPRGHRAS